MTSWIKCSLDSIETDQELMYEFQSFMDSIVELQMGKALITSWRKAHEVCRHLDCELTL